MKREKKKRIFTPFHACSQGNVVAGDDGGFNIASTTTKNKIDNI